MIEGNFCTCVSSMPSTNVLRLTARHQKIFPQGLGAIDQVAHLFGESVRVRSQPIRSPRQSLRACVYRDHAPGSEPDLIEPAQVRLGVGDEFLQSLLKALRLHQGSVSWRATEFLPGPPPSWARGHQFTEAIEVPRAAAIEEITDSSRGQPTMTLTPSQVRFTKWR